MVIVGSTGSFTCLVEYADNKMHVDGPKKGFYGYKLGSSSGTNGIYIEWNIEKDSLKLSNDKFGFFPCYYIKNKNSFAFSTSIFDLLAMDETRRLDSDAIAVFLRMGRFIGDTTPFKNIKALPPGTTLQFSKGHLSLQSNRIKYGRAKIGSLDEAQAHYGELFQKSMESFGNIFSKKVAVPLSGGRDSRHILFALMRLGKKPFSCITMKHQPPKPDEDAEIAKKVCKSLGVNHIILEQPLSLLNAIKETNKIINLVSLGHSWILPLAKYLLEENYDAIFEGTGGDVLSAGSLTTKQKLNLYREEKFEELAEEILLGEGYLPKMLTKSAYKRFNRDRAIDILITELKAHSNALDPVGQFYFWNTTRRHVAMAPFRLLSNSCQVYAPYMNHKIYEFLTSIPAEYILNHRFHEETIRKFYPEYSHLPYETKKSPSKRGNYIKNCYQISEFLIYFLGSLGKQSMLNPFFIYPRVIKGFLSPSFYNKSKNTCERSIFLKELTRLFLRK